MRRWKPVFEVVRPNSYRNSVKRSVDLSTMYVLRRVTGGANGLGEHNKSFMTDAQYTPSASTMSSLKSTS